MTFKLFAAAAALALGTGAASAATYTVTAGDNYCDDRSGFSGSPCTDVGELGQNPGDDIFELALNNGDSAALYGYVAGQGADQYADTATVRGNGTYRITVNLTGDVIGGDNFDAELKFGIDSTLGGLSSVGTVSNTAPSWTTTVSLLAGTDYSLAIDAAGGDFSGGEAMTYNVSIAAVPLPAGGLLLLGGLGAFGIARRRRKAA